MQPAMMTRPNLQLWVVSTAGTPHRSSVFLGAGPDRPPGSRRRVDAPAIAFFEWSAPDDADPADPDTWRACMPALGSHRFRGRRQGGAQVDVPRSQFARAYLESLGLVDGRAAHRPRFLAVPEDRRSAARVVRAGIGYCTEGRERVDRRRRRARRRAALCRAEHGPGTEWVPAALERLCVEYEQPRVFVDSKAVAHMLPALERAYRFQGQRDRYGRRAGRVRVLPSDRAAGQAEAPRRSRADDRARRCRPAHARGWLRLEPTQQRCGHHTALRAHVGSVTVAGKLGSAMSTVERPYGHEWRKARARVLKDAQACAICGGLLDFDAPATLAALTVRRSHLPGACDAWNGPRGASPDAGGSRSGVRPVHLGCNASAAGRAA